MQMGFDMGFVDARTGEAVPWATPTAGLLSEIASAKWKVVDLETTESNPASPPLVLCAKEVQSGWNSAPRTRVISTLYPHCGTNKVAVFEMDMITQAERLKVAQAMLTGTFIAHHAGFDLGWLAGLTSQRPNRVLDSMLIARALNPKQRLQLAALANDELADEQLRQGAISVFEGRRSGWSLADLALTVLSRHVAKDLQGPKNWCKPILTQEDYDYATGDVRTVYDMLVNLLEMSPQEDLLEAYLKAEAGNPTLQLFAPQVSDIWRMRERGMPWSLEEATSFTACQRHLVREQAAQMLAIEPALAPFGPVLASFEAGVTDDLKHALGKAFRDRGLNLERTEKTGVPKVGEKDLRKAMGGLSEEARPLFDAWRSLCRAKKFGQMASDFSGYARRSHDGRIHSNIGHGPVTGRLASADPNGQQIPADQKFRNAVRARPGFKIAAVDYSAMDMRVGAALAIRAQRQIAEVYEGTSTREVATDVRTAIYRAYEHLVTLEQARVEETKAAAALRKWQEQADDNRDRDQTRRFWERWRVLSREALIARFTRCLVYVRGKAEEAGTPEWGYLRDAFAIPGMDIHTYYGLSINDDDPAQLLKGLAGSELKAAFEFHKKRLGGKRKSSKVRNLSLTYAMKDKGFQENGAKIHDIHMTLEEAHEARIHWLGTNVEMDLWHAWTELNEFARIRVPDPDFGMRWKSKAVYASYTLSGRLIFAEGLNAALSYENQSTGADIFGDVMKTLREEYPEVEACIVNQVHDEAVAEIPDAHAEDYTQIIADVMVQCAEKLMGPYGVRAEVSPELGQVWIKG